MSIADKLIQLNTTKQNIKQAIIDKGVDLTGVPFTDYPDKIRAIETVATETVKLMSQTEYDNLTTKNENTYYLILETKECENCEGTGQIFVAGGACPVCDGTGTIIENEMPALCLKCGGDGIVEDEYRTCSVCSGTGVVVVE